MINNEKDLISVVVVTYNSSKTIRETIDSLIEQTYGNVEIIISDDCSVDDTVDIARNALTSSKYEKWQIVPSTKNKGVVNNENKGIKNAKGKYIKLLGGDDVLARNAIERFYHLYNESEICVSDCCFFGEDEKACAQRKKYYDDKQYFYSKSSKEQYNELIIHNPITAPSVGLMSKDFIENYGFFDVKYPTMEDYPFWMKCSKDGIRFKKINEELVKYRVVHNSASDNRESAFFKSDKKFFWNVRFWKLLQQGRVVMICKQLTYYCNFLYHIKVKIRREI